MRADFRRRLKIEELEERRLLAADWTNAANPLDVNMSGLVTALDALIVINDINSSGVRGLATKAPEVSGAMVDVNGDGNLSALDALRVINALNEFALPMALELNLEGSLPPDTDPEAEGLIFGGQTLPRSNVRLERVIDGLPATSATMVADASGEFQFELEAGDTSTIYRIVATDLLGRADEVDFRLEAGQTGGQENPRLALHFPVGVGSVAPNVKLLNQDGVEVDMSELLEESVVVLYFYPRDNTPGCSAEAKAFRDRKVEIESFGAKVIGVSLDSVESHKQFADEYELNFDILSDLERKVTVAYGNLGLLNGTPIAKRSTFIIGQDGIIKEVFKDVNVAIHGQQVIDALQNGIAQ